VFPTVPLPAINQCGTLKQEVYCVVQGGNYWVVLGTVVNSANVSNIVNKAVLKLHGLFNMFMDSKSM